MDDPLTIREIQDILKLSSPSVAHHHIRQLERKGYLKRNPDNPKDYRILTDPEKPITRLNLYGMAQCGPNGSILDGNPIDRIPVASRLISFPAEDAFLVKAKGDSMEPVIMAGDLVITKNSNQANSGEIIVGVNDSMVIIKKYIIENRQIVLHSQNEAKYAPIIAEKEHFRIEGIVKGIIRYQ